VAHKMGSTALDALLGCFVSCEDVDSWKVIQDVWISNAEVKASLSRFYCPRTCL